MTAMVLVGWVVIIGAWLVIGMAMAVIIGSVIHRNTEIEQAEWRAHQRPPGTPMRSDLWMRDEPTWQFPARPRIYDQANGSTTPTS